MRGNTPRRADIVRFDGPVKWLAVALCVQRSAVTSNKDRSSRPVLPDTLERTEPNLLIKARAEGLRDVFAGKRAWPRYNLGMRLDVTTDPTRPSAKWTVSLHNISGGGLGFWSKQAVSLGTFIHILDCNEDGSAAWLPARITHCTVGMRGYLLGAAFANPTDPNAREGAEPAPRKESTRRPARTMPGRPGTPLRSISAQYAYSVAATSLVTLLVSQAAARYFGFAPGSPGVLGLSILTALPLGLGFGWLIAWRDAKFLQALQLAIRGIAVGRPTSAPLTEAPSKELSAIRRAFHDLWSTWQRHEQDERIQRQKLEELNQVKTNILSIVSHDLRTPLTSILLYAQMLQDDITALAEDDRRNFAGIITEECNRLSRLLDDLLEVQRLESDTVRLDLQPRDLALTVRNCVRVFEAMAESKSMSLTLKGPASLPPVEADTDKIAQVLNNLISNALKYTQPGGAVVVSTEVRGTEVILHVADNGPGIPRDKWDQIFDRFSQLSDPNTSEIAGVGLGLYIVKRIIEDHGGKVWVDSEVGRGTAFYVSLPTKAAHESASEEPCPAQQDDSAVRSAGPTPSAASEPCDDTPNNAPPVKAKRKMPTARVVVCDSDPELAATISNTLRAENFDVRLAHSGYRLLTQLDRGDADVVVTDILLPDMGSGELLDALVNLPNRSFRTIVHSYEGDHNDLKRRGVDIFLERPVTKVELIQAVRVALQKRSAAGLIVILVDSESIDSSRLSDVLTDGGHMMMIAGNLNEAAALVRNYACDAVILSSQSLTHRWSNLRELNNAATGDTRIFVLCESLGKSERRLQGVHRVMAVPYNPGMEEGVLDVVLDDVGNTVAEVSG